MQKVIFVLAMLASVSARAAERYIIPIWGLRVQGATGEYTGTIAMTNLSDADATVKVTKIVPMLAHTCPYGPCAFSQWTLYPHFTRVISDQGESIVYGGREMDLGAVEIESDRPINVASEVFRGEWSNAVSWQSVEVARDWVTGASMIPRGLPEGGMFKLYLINPNDFQVRFDYRSDYSKDRTALVAANSIEVIELDSRVLGPEGGAEQPTGFALSLYVNAEFPYLAATVSRANSSISPDVRIARPLTKSQ